MAISKQTAHDIALAYREIEIADALLKEISETMARRETPDIRDAFGRRVDGLELGVPTNSNSKRMFNVPWNLARPIIESHISSQRQLIAALTEKVRIELEQD